MPSSLADPAAARDRRRALFITAAVIATFTVFPAFGGPAAGGRLTAALQAGWGAWTALMALLVGRAPRRWRAWPERAALVAPALFHGAIAAATGGAHSPAFPWMIAIPVVAAALLKEDVVGVALSGAAAVLATALLVWPLPAPAALSALPVLQVLAAVALSVVASRSYRAVLRRDRSVHAARLRLLRQLKVSERRRASAERLATVGQLAAGVAHEVNNPLAFVRANITFLEEELEAGELDERERREVLAETQVGVDRIARIVECLHTFSREKPARPALCSVDEVARAALRTLPTGMAAAVELDLAAFAVTADAPLLAEALGSLLLNAVEAAAAGSRAPRVVLAARWRNAVVDLFVEDSGAGVPAALRGRLFEPFFTTKPPGMGVGLGLAVAREYATQMGGTLTLEPSGALGGARFRFTLPGPQAAAVEVPPPRRESARFDASPARRSASPT